MDEYNYVSQDYSGNFIVVINGQQIGTYSTQPEAEQAFNAAINGGGLPSPAPLGQTGQQGTIDPRLLQSAISLGGLKASERSDILTAAANYMRELGYSVSPSDIQAALGGGALPTSGTPTLAAQQLELQRENMLRQLGMSEQQIAEQRREFDLSQGLRERQQGFSEASTLADLMANPRNLIQGMLLAGGPPSIPGGTIGTGSPLLGVGAPGFGDSTMNVGGAAPTNVQGTTFQSKVPALTAQQIIAQAPQGEAYNYYRNYGDSLIGNMGSFLTPQQAARILARRPDVADASARTLGEDVSPQDRVRWWLGGAIKGGDVNGLQIIMEEAQRENGQPISNPDQLLAMFPDVKKSIIQQMGSPEGSDTWPATRFLREWFRIAPQDPNAQRAQWIMSQMPGQVGFTSPAGYAPPPPGAPTVPGATAQAQPYNSLVSSVSNFLQGTPFYKNLVGSSPLSNTVGGNMPFIQGYQLPVRQTLADILAQSPRIPLEGGMASFAGMFPENFFGQFEQRLPQGSLAPLTQYR